MAEGYGGWSGCGWCGNGAVRVRKDGTLWRHWDHQRNETCRQVAEELDSPTVELLAAMDDPAPVSDADAFLFDDPEPVQEKRRQTNGRGYLAKDPDLGDFRRYKNGNIKPITRVSTFVKASSNRTALTDWQVRNTLLGAAHFPEIAARAKELHPNPEGPLPEDKGTKAELDRIADELGEKVGSKRAADRGTEVHASVEKVAKGLVPVDKIEDELPTDHVPWVLAFLACLEEYGFELMPDLVERTVFVSEFGGIMGRFDQAVRDVRSGNVVRMTDVKTGSLDYAFREIQGQLKLYQHGYSTHGTYVWGETEDLDRWEPPKYRMADDFGIVFHLPVKSGVPQCIPIKVYLDEGWEHIELCAKNREAASNARKPEVWTPVPVVEQPAPEPEQRDWDAEFGQATSKLHLAGLYESARSVIDDEPRLRSLIDIGMARLKTLENEPPF